MAESAKINNRIKKIFKNMEYGHSGELTQLALDWLKTKENAFFAYIDNPTEQPNGTPITLLNTVNKESVGTTYVPDIDTIKNILAKNNEKKWLNIDPFERTKIINKIGTEIEKKADLFAQLEILTRGILAKDTKTKAVPFLAQYFQYYSAFAFTFDEATKKHQGCAVGVISNENYLPHLGLFLATALAAGCNIVLQIGLQLSPIAFLLQDIALSSGVPEGVLRIIPSDDGELLPYLTCDKVEIVTLFVDLNNEKYRGINSSNKKILVLTSYKTPAIVFDSADLDAASENLIESSWSYQSMLPWSTDTILVQENIYPTFVSKLKSRLKSLEVSTADNKLAHLSIDKNNEDGLERLNNLIKQAKLQGIEVFQAREDANLWTPTLFIGGKVTHNALNSNYRDAKAVTVLAFRSIDEAINLANNTKQGLWASIWSENSSVINEAVRKLKVSNICINGSYGYSPDVVISPIKESGIGNFGGKEGFLEYLSLETTKHCFCTNKSAGTSATNIDSIVNNAKKAQESWQRVSKIKKQKIFQEVAENLAPLTNHTGECEREWSLKHIYTAIMESQKGNMASTVAGYNLTSVKEPRGVIVINRSEHTNAQLILTSLFEGNSLIVITAGNCSDPILKLLSGKLPSGVVNMVTYDSTVLKKLSMNKKVNCYFGDDGEHIFRCLSLRDSKNYLSVAQSGEDIYSKVGFVKNIWSDIGKSLTFE